MIPHVRDHLGWLYHLHSSISTALMRPRRPKQYCLQLVVYIYIYIFPKTNEKRKSSFNFSFAFALRVSPLLRLFRRSKVSFFIDFSIFIRQRSLQFLYINMCVYIYIYIYIYIIYMYIYMYVYIHTEEV